MARRMGKRPNANFGSAASPIRPRTTAQAQIRAYDAEKELERARAQYAASALGWAEEILRAMEAGVTVPGHDLSVAIELLKQSWLERPSARWCHCASEFGNLIVTAVQESQLPYEGYSTARLLFENSIPGLEGDAATIAAAAHSYGTALQNSMRDYLIQPELVAAELGRSPEHASQAEIDQAVNTIRTRWAEEALRILDESIDRFKPTDLAYGALIATRSTVMMTLVDEDRVDAPALNDEIGKIQAALAALTSTNPWHPDKAIYQSNLANLISLGVRKGWRAVTDMHDAVTRSRQALLKTDIEGPRYAGRLGRLSYALSIQAEHFPEMRPSIATELADLVAKARTGMDRRLGNPVALRAFSNDCQYLVDWGMPIIADYLGPEAAILAIESIVNYAGRLEQLDAPAQQPYLGLLATNLATDQLGIYLVGSRWGVRALILDHVGSCQLVKFPDLNESEITSYLSLLNQRMANGEKSDSAIRSILRELWPRFGQILVEELQDPGRGGAFPRRVTFLPQGRLAAVPFFAATSDLGESLDDHFVISVMTVLESSPPAPASAANGSVVITSSDENLTYLESDVRAARRFVEPPVTFVEPELSTVLAGLDGASVAILCGHGVYRWVDGTAFQLSDGLLGSRLLLTALSKRKRGFAFLNACESNRFGERSPDDALGIPNALLRCGFSEVVGTHWSVSDLEAHLVLTAVLERRALNSTRSLSECLRDAKEFLRGATGTELINWMTLLGFIGPDSLKRLADSWTKPAGTVDRPLSTSLDIAAYACFGMN